MLIFSEKVLIITFLLLLFLFSLLTIKKSSTRALFHVHMIHNLHIFVLTLLLFPQPFLLLIQILIIPQRHVKLPEVLSLQNPKRVQRLLHRRALLRHLEALEVLLEVQVRPQLPQASLRTLYCLLYCLLHQVSGVFRVLKLALCH